MAKLYHRRPFFFVAAAIAILLPQLDRVFPVFIPVPADFAAFNDTVAYRIY